MYVCGFVDHFVGRQLVSLDPRIIDFLLLKCCFCDRLNFQNKAISIQSFKHLISEICLSSYTPGPLRMH